MNFCFLKIAYSDSAHKLSSPSSRGELGGGEGGGSYLLSQVPRGASCGALDNKTKLATDYQQLVSTTFFG